MTASCWKAKIDGWLETHAPELNAMYEELHELAEVAWQERRTTAAIVDKLTAIGLEVRTFPEHTGAIGAWGGANAGRTVALRADIDALWQQVDGEWRANHSCGHDAHTTMVYGAVRCLKEIGYEIREGRLLAIFQPAEETAEGARTLVRTGALDEVDAMLGIHLRPQKELPFGQASSAIYHGGSARLTGRVKGKAAHAARPEDGVNAIEAFAAIALAIRDIHIPAEQSGSCKVTTVRVPNETTNIIPDYAEFKADIRAATPELLAELGERVRQAALEAGRACGADIEAELSMRAAPAVPDAGMERLVGEAIAEALGGQNLAAPVVTPGAEDFHFYKMERSGLRATMVGLGSGLTPGLHAPEMTFDREALRIGTGILALSAIKLLEEQP